MLLEGEDDGLVDDEGFDEFGGGELRVAVVQDLIDDFVEQGEVLAQDLFGQNATEVFDDLRFRGEEPAFVSLSRHSMMKAGGQL